MFRKGTALIAAVLVFVVFLPAPASAKEMVARSLEGLKGVYVDVVLSGSMEGITAESLKMSIEKQLARAGIRIFPKGQFDRYSRSGNYPFGWLVVGLAFSEGPSEDLAVVLLSIRLQQQSHLARRPRVVFWAPTWESRAILVRAAPEFLRQHLSKGIDTFIADFLSANP
ncbi:MAG: hypothetical protein JRH13_10550 [Deltaproteobacteria bacterium]|nr:hypothetical protein [Deltaproteobacteria bacterium]MBW2129790.1 hypothetical protein [Deltaproteobacteria bacterium]MBW2303456.1 hypothetical protein [Deltaproteobacteria bacterium]